MGRMHSGAKGRSGSHKPLKKALPSWIRYKAKEVELLVVKAAKETRSPSKIGAILRDSYGIPDVKKITGKKITQILEEKKLMTKIPEDLTALIRKGIQLRKHFDSNKQDKTALRGIQLTSSKINRLVKYYKKSGKLPADWKYTREQAGMLIE